MTTPEHNPPEAPRRRGRGRALPVGPKMAKAVDRALLDVLTHGVPCLDPATNQPVLDQNGKPIKKPAPAAYLNAALKRIAQFGPKETRYENDQSTVSDIIKAARLRLAGRQSEREGGR